MAHMTLEHIQVHANKVLTVSSQTNGIQFFDKTTQLGHLEASDSSSIHVNSKITLKLQAVSNKIFVFLHTTKLNNTLVALSFFMQQPALKDITLRITYKYLLNYFENGPVFLKRIFIAFNRAIQRKLVPPDSQPHL